MKLAISIEGNSIDSSIDEHFGRCARFLVCEVHDNEVKNTEIVDNPGMSLGHGAGMKAAEAVAGKDVQVIITGSLGPKATDVLKQFNIRCLKGTGTAKEAIDAYLRGDLSEIDGVSLPHSSLTKKDDSMNPKGERIFFPLMSDNGMESVIADHFGHAPLFGIYKTDEKKLEVMGNTLNHTDPNKSPVDQIVETVNPTIVFTKGIGERAINLFKEKGVSLKTGKYLTVGEVVADLEDLSDQTKDCGHEHHHH